ncbi:TPA: hypothetical protein N0F65_012392 [Lagenidium giganteum]|uniref:Calmodulin n=1 Tax=Lagenidium giganteum TaxID=4803 RepID=A0AAV2YME5_9STRA|nr:TPA: hypothetical protein N0F65_012392 [Lagenidium giganteum]
MRQSAAVADYEQLGVATVTLVHASTARQVLVYPGIPLAELRQLLVAGLLQHQSPPKSHKHGWEDAPVALHDRNQDVLFPLSLLATRPSFFDHGTYHVVCEKDSGLPARNGSARTHNRAARRSSGRPPVMEEEDEDRHATGDSDNQSEDEEEDDDDDDEFLREMDLTDFELPQLVNVFTQACPTGALDQTTFHRCLEKILSQVGRYDQLALKMFTRIYNIFDTSKSGVVDVAEFLGGLSVFASGERDEKIRFTFDLFDMDNDGYISLEEMTKYLTSFFLVIAETSPELFQQNNVDPVELGRVTARQCFSDATLNDDGELSYEEFQKWYSKPGPTEIIKSSALVQSPEAVTDNSEGDEEGLTLARMREVTGLASLSVDDLFSIFSSACTNEGGELTRDQFKQCFYSILKAQKKKPSRALARFLDRLFTSFDVDGNDAVDFMELSSGLSVLCDGSREEKVMAAFSLFDTDGDGYITEEEMTTYLASVFSVMFETNPQTKKAIPLDAKTLAWYTTKQAFEEADLNNDGLLSLEEFRKWYLSAGQLVQSLPMTMPAPPNVYAQQHYQLASTQRAVQSIEYVAELSGLRDRKASDVFEIIASKVNDDGVLSREAFHEIFEQLVQEQALETRVELDSNKRAELHNVLDSVFSSFDADNDGFVDFCELSSGLSIFCDGSQDEKIKSAFALFDINQDGFISREEMETYLSSVYRIVFTLSPYVAEQMRISPEQLARITTNDAFAEVDTNKDDRLSYEEFSKWFSTQPTLFGGQVPPVTDHSVPLLFSRDTLKEMKQLTNLGSYDVNDIFDFFKSSADSTGNLDQATFFRCFNKLLARTAKDGDRARQNKTRELLKDLFDLFDTDQNGFIDVKELGAGLSILCGGSREDKAASLFTLYDANGDGVISPPEMTEFLTALFKVLYKASPDLQAKTQLNPLQLAVATTASCFNSFNRNRGHGLSQQEFREWFDSQSAHAKLVRQMSKESSNGGFKRQGSGESDSQPRSGVIPMEVAKKLSGLKDIPLEKVAQLFSSSADAKGLISREAFDTCFYKYLCANSSTRLTAEESEMVHDVIDRLFTAFDTDKNGFVDFNELSSGLSILCGGSRDDKVQAAFDLYDTNGDGFISEEEMVHYLASVFKLLYALDPTRQDNLGITADELAMVTAAEIFSEADLNNDGKLNFEEFQRWYSQPQQESFNEIVAPLDLNEVRRLTNLGSLDVVEVFERFAEHADENGLLMREAFDRCFLDIIEAVSHPRTDVEKLRAKVVADRLFDVFDRDGNGKIDFSELASGLSVLCKGARDAKVKAAFQLYDFNSDGYISLDEMTKYLTSIFKVLYEIQPEMRQETGVTAEELGAVTAEQAFMEADSNKDGKLSYEEFLTWYTSPSIAGISSSVAKNAVVDSSLRWMPLNEIKQLTSLSDYSPEEVFEIFATEANKEGLLSRSAFNSCFREVISGGSKEKLNQLSPSMKGRIKEVVDGLFDLFDADNSGYVDFGELASGLSVLSGGTKDQKVEAAFALFDFNGDGFISLEEMVRYLTSVFRVLYQVSPDTQNLGVSPEELGQVTAQQAFAEADLDHDGRLSLEEFKSWYQQPGGIGEVAKNGEQLFSIAEARRLTNLESFSPMEVFEALADSADENGCVSREAFDECFRKIIASNRGIKTEEYKRINIILNRLFELFDTNKNGVVDFSEISSGLSVFCGGTSEEKVRAAFTLYDYNGDGYISKDEMARYLTSVFKVLKEASPSSITKVSESAEDLGAQTAEQAFLEADLDRDGRLTLDEFRRWYTQSSAANIERLIENNIPEWLSLREVRRLTNLSSYSSSEVFETFASFSSGDGTLDRAAFRKAFDHLKAPENNSESDDRLRLLVDRIFALFDADGNGVVDFSELASGLSILCGGSQLDKVRSAFNLYDVNHDGFISLGEMRLYLTSVFKVLFEVNPDTQARMGVTAEELGEITAEQAFAEADMDKDGKLSFEEFRSWYMQPSSVMNQSHVPDWVSLQVVKQMTHLEKHTPEEVFEIFANRCSQDGTVSREAFEECFEDLVDERFKKDSEHLSRLRLVLDRLFTLFDVDGNGVVDFCELSSGLSVLCGGSREQKVRSAFALYDLNQDGYISLDEMTRYLASVFKVLYETTPGTQASLGVSPDELAAVTAEQCFAEADLNHDGRLSFDEFVKWFSHAPDFSSPLQAFSSTLTGAPKKATPSMPLTKQEKKAETPSPARGGAPKNDAKATDAASSGEGGDYAPTSPFSINSSGMERVRHLLKLDAYEVNDVFEIFAEAAPSGELTFASFKKCFDQIIKLAGGHSSPEERQEADLIIRRLFRVFDTDKSNTVDFGELASGLSVLSGSSMDDKVRAAFQLYDINGDGYISLDEMTSYMTSIFKVMYETSDNTKTKMGVGPEELARVTAIQCFKEADLNHDMKLSFDEFKKWCTSGL